MSCLSWARHPVCAGHPPGAGWPPPSARAARYARRSPVCAACLRLCGRGWGCSENGNRGSTRREHARGRRAGGLAHTRAIHHGNPLTLATRSRGGESIAESLHSHDDSLSSAVLQVRGPIVPVTGHTCDRDLHAQKSDGRARGRGFGAERGRRVRGGFSRRGGH